MYKRKYREEKFCSGNSAKFIKIGSASVKMKILLVNPNVTEDITSLMLAEANQFAHHELLQAIEVWLTAH